LRRKSAGQKEGTAQVGLQHAVPDVRGDRLEVLERDADVPGGIIHEDVDPPEPRDDFLGRPVDRVGVALVELHGERLSTHRFDGCDRFGGSVRVPDVGEGHVGTGLGQRLTYRPAHVSRTARDERDRAREVHDAPRCLRGAMPTRAHIAAGAKAAP